LSKKQENASDVPFLKMAVIPLRTERMLGKKRGMGPGEKLAEELNSTGGKIKGRIQLTNGSSITHTIRVKNM